MESNKKSRGISVAALIVAVISLAIGFAAFTSSLTIEPSATVTPEQDDFDVKFSPDESGEEGDGIVEPSTKVPEDLEADDATIDNSVKGKPRITGLHADFTAPGQSVTYEFYINNDSPYMVYLKSVIYENVSSQNVIKKCTARSSTDNPLVAAACEDISVKIKIGEGSNVVETSGSLSSTSHTLAKNTVEKVLVTIEYADNGHVSDEAFDVAFGDIVLTYSTASGN